MTKEEFVSKYLGRMFGQGASGCFLFVKEAYGEVFGIELENDYLEMLNIFGQVKNKDLLQFGDIVLIKNHPIIMNHIGFYLSNDEYADYTQNIGVTVKRLDDFRYSHRIIGYLRHPQLKK